MFKNSLFKISTTDINESVILVYEEREATEKALQRAVKAESNNEALKERVEQAEKAAEKWKSELEQTLARERGARESEEAVNRVNVYSNEDDSQSDVRKSINLYFYQ